MKGERQLKRALSSTFNPSVVGRIMIPQRWPCPNLWNLWICYFKWQKGFCRCNQGYAFDMDYPGGSNLLTRVFKIRQTFLTVVREWCDDKERAWGMMWEGLIQPLLVLKMKQVIMSQRMKAASRSWKRQIKVSSQTSRRKAALPTFWF